MMIRMMKNTLLGVLVGAAALPALADSHADAKAQAEPEPSIVVTSEGLVERCILPLVITEIDGEAVEEDAGRYEFSDGKSHSFRGYAQGDFTACATIADAGLGADSPIGEGSTSVTVPAGKAYFLGLDVRKADRSTWKVVTWRINH